MYRNHLKQFSFHVIRETALGVTTTMAGCGLFAMGDRLLNGSPTPMDNHTKTAQPTSLISTQLIEHQNDIIQSVKREF